MLYAVHAPPWKTWTRLLRVSVTQTRAVGTDRDTGRHVELPDRGADAIADRPHPRTIAGRIDPELFDPAVAGVDDIQGPVRSEASAPGNVRLRACGHRAA